MDVAKIHQKFFAPSAQKYPPYITVILMHRGQKIFQLKNNSIFEILKISAPQAKFFHKQCKFHEI